MRTFGCTDELIEFHLNCFGVSILGVLNQKNHQERDDRGTRVDGQLPGVAEAEYRPRNYPSGDDTDSKNKHPRPTTEVRSGLGKPGVQSGVTHAGN